jgi:hypothetical protein
VALTRKFSVVGFKWEGWFKWEVWCKRTQKIRPYIPT